LRPLMFVGSAQKSPQRMGHPLVRAKMENVHALRVPLLVEMGVGPNWRDVD